MAGQEKLIEKDLYTKYSNELKRQAEFKYVYDYYRVGEQFNKRKFLQAILLEKYLCTDLCEIKNEINGKEL